MKSHLLALLACVVFVSGCATTPNATRGPLAIRITTLLGLQASERDFRIQVDGRFVGNYDPEGTVLELPPGTHRVVVTLPSGADIRRQPDGSATVRTFSLSGDERIEVLGGGSRQSLIFNETNLKRREVEDETEH